MDTKALLDKITEKTGIDASVAESLLDSLLKITGDECSDMNSIAIPGFGSFESKKRQERVAVHPSTGKRMLIPPKITLSFRPSALLKQKVKNS